MKFRYIIYTLVVLGLAYLIYYRISANKKIENSGKGPGTSKGGAQGAQVEGIVVTTGKFNNDLEISGTIEANESVALQSEVAGLVTNIYFKEGSNVSKGSQLVKINDRDIQAQLQEALTKQKLSATNEGRAKQLLAKGAISQEEYDTSLADLESLRAQAQLIRTQLARTIIRAPFSGKIGLRNISVGEYLTPSKIIANLMSTNPVKLSFAIPEKYASQIDVNSGVNFTTGGSSKSHTAKVFAIEPGINTQTRTLNIKALATNPNNELLPGAFAKIKLALSMMENAILIPNEAVIPVLKGKTVFISSNGKAKQVEVVTETRTSSEILVTSGLKVGDTVLTTGAMSLKPDMPVKVKLIKR